MKNSFVMFKQNSRLRKIEGMLELCTAGNFLEKEMMPQEIPRKSGLIFLTSFIICLVLLYITELSLRQFDLSPTLTDDIELWAFHRSRINSSNKQVVLLGNSRMLTDFDVRAAQKKLPKHEFVQLSILGSSPLPVLKDIAEKSSFQGLIIIALTEADINFYHSTIDRGLSQQYVEYYQNEFKVSHKIEREITTILQENLVFFHPFYNLRNNLVNLVLLRKPIEFYANTDRYRSRNLNYTDVDIIQVQSDRIKKIKSIHREEVVLSPSQWIASAKEISRYVELVKQRGGNVVIVYLPISGENESWIAHLYPRQKYWDQLEKQLNLNTIHYQDSPELIFEAPDTSHLDKRDKSTFTTNLLAILEPWFYGNAL